MAKRCGDTDQQTSEPQILLRQLIHRDQRSRRVMTRALPQVCFFCGDASADPVCDPCTAAAPRLPAESCPRCQLASANGDVCGRCLKKPPQWQRLHARWRYDFPLDHAVLAAKYQHQFALYRWAIGTLTAWPFDTATRVTVLPVPLAPERLAERGYNQATLIARELVCRFDATTRAPALRVDADAVLRVRETAVQQRLNWVERRRNVRGAFAVTRAFDGEIVLLVDDVLTTGATLNELARVLTAAGAARVDALVLARVQPIRRRERSNAFGQAVN